MAEYATIPAAGDHGRVGWSARHEAAPYATATADPHDDEPPAARGSVAWQRAKRAELAAALTATAEPPSIRMTSDSTPAERTHP